MYKVGLIVLFFSLFVFVAVQAQVETHKANLNRLADRFTREFNLERQEAIEFARINNIPIRIENDTVLKVLMRIDERGIPQYYTTFNANAAITSSTNQVYSGGAAGLNLDGSGISVCEWDGGTVRTTHQEFGVRAVNVDASAIHWHSTHVAGTIIAAGLYSPAKGMAFAATLKSYDWDYDNAEMATEAANGNLISNHSYGWVRGWSDGVWHGDPAISVDEDYKFGFYDITARNWDEISYNAPNYLIVKSAGNDRGNFGDGSYPPDGPYDCLPQKGVAKNILTVGAVDDIAGGYSNPTEVNLASFSSCGPADDGRIKPDIVANGIALISTYSSADDAYASSSGTSMSAPATTGSLALLIQHYENVNGLGAKMRSATLKALVLHTADEAGDSDGPDYEFGWGLLNTQKAAEKITEDQTTDVISELVLSNGETFTREITTTGTSPIRVTIVWTDPPGTPPAASLDPADVMLVNDLDLRITEGDNTYYPWKLNRDIPTDSATNLAENNVDNVQMVDINSPLDGTTYTITVDHDGILASPQSFSMIISGDIEGALAPIPVFSADNTQPTTEQTVSFIDASINIPTSHTWSFSPATVTYVNGTSSTSKNPKVVFNEEMDYTVILTATNAYGSNVETKTDYISVTDVPVNYCDAFSLSPYGFIIQVQMGSLDNASWFTNAGGGVYYEDFTSSIVDVTVGETINITVTNYYTTPEDDGIDLAIWADWNRDGDFEDSDEEIVCETDNRGHGTFSINVPTYANLGKTRLRIRTKWVNSYGCIPCGTTYEGEVEDYTLNIQPASTNWIGTTTIWNDAANWPGGIVPNASYEVIISAPPAGGNFPVIPFGVSATCYSLTLLDNATITIYGTLEVVK